LAAERAQQISKALKWIKDPPRTGEVPPEEVPRRPAQMKDRAKSPGIKEISIPRNKGVQSFRSPLASIMHSIFQFEKTNPHKMAGFL
jgi:hypothetical protein